MRQLSVIIVLQAYALLLAWWQSLHHVLTDEAKYLLNIPYPHPPLLRWLMSLTESEILWRIIGATVLVQVVWFIWNTTRNKTICALWLMSAAVVLQAGSIMMAPYTALFGLLFVLLYVSDTKSPYLAGTLWLVSLFTALQSVLFLPLVGVVVWRARVSLLEKGMIIVGPIVVLGLYILTNPLIPASMLNLSGIARGMTLIQSVQGVVYLWILGGSAVVSILGLLGILRAKSLPLLCTFGLITLYAYSAYHDYYAILFTPVLLGGLMLRPALVRYANATVVLTIFVTGFFFFRTDVSTPFARGVLQHVRAEEGVVLINGAFGHEWQYESPVPVQRFAPNLLEKAVAVVCLETCDNVSFENWEHIENDSLTLYVRPENIQTL